MVIGLKVGFRKGSNHSFLSRLFYNRAIVYKRQSFFKAVFHMIIGNQTSRALYEIQLTVIYSRTCLVAVPSEYIVKKGYL